MIFVTEAAGLSGSIVMQEFARQKMPMRALVRDRAKVKKLATSPIVETECAFIDACRKADMRHVVKVSGAEPDFDPAKFLFARLS